jgi:hypothetical protein
MESNRYSGLEHVPTCSTWPPPWLNPSTLAASTPAPPKPRAVVSPGDLPPDLYEYWQERAGIREFDGGLPRSKAEALALADVLGNGEIDEEERAGPAPEIAKADEAAAVASSTMFPGGDAGP